MPCGHQDDIRIRVLCVAFCRHRLCVDLQLVPPFLCPYVARIAATSSFSSLSALVKNRSPLQLSHIPTSTILLVHSNATGEWQTSLQVTASPLEVSYDTSAAAVTIASRSVDYRGRDMAEFAAVHCRNLVKTCNLPQKQEQRDVNSKSNREMVKPAHLNLITIAVDPAWRSCYHSQDTAARRVLKNTLPLTKYSCMSSRVRLIRPKLTRLLRIFVMLASFLDTIVAIWLARAEEPSSIATAIILVHTVLTPPILRIQQPRRSPNMQKHTYNHTHSRGGQEHHGKLPRIDLQRIRLDSVTGMASLPAVFLREEKPDLFEPVAVR